MSERLTDVAVRPTAEHYTLPTSQEVEDEIAEQRSIGVTAHVQKGGLLMPHLYKRAANHWKRPPRFERRQSEQEEEESRPLRKSGSPRSLKDITKAKPSRRAPWK